MVHKVWVCLQYEINHVIGPLCGSGQLSRYSDLLRAGRSGDRIPVGARFSAPVQTTPGAYPASCTMGTGSFLGVKRPGSNADHPPPSKRRGRERIGLYFYSSSGPPWPVIGWTLLLLIYINSYSSVCRLPPLECSSLNNSEDHKKIR